MAETKKTILLVEDDPSLMEMYKLRLTEDGYNLVVAQDGVAGLELAQQQQPVVILLDVMMPKMDGFAVLTELKKDERTKNIPVLLLSNLGQEADIVKGKQLGAVDYIVKSSLTPSQVSEKIKTLLH